MSLCCATSWQANLPILAYHPLPERVLVVAHAKAEAGQHGDGVARVAYGKLKHSNYSFRSPSQAECWHFIWQKRARLLDK